MEEWKTYRLGDLCKTNIAQYSNKDDWSTVLYLNTGNITNNKIANIITINDLDNLPSRAKRKVKHKDIIYSTVRPNQRHYGILLNPPHNLLVSTGFTVITVNQDVAEPHYIFYYLTQNKVVDYLHSLAEQSVSAYPSIKSSDLENIELNIPPLYIQTQIANILSSLDDKIEINRKINEDLEQQAQALFKSWFVNFEPFREGKFIDSELGKIPEGWRVELAENIYSITIGKTPPRNEHQWFTKNIKDVKWVSIADLGTCGMFINNSAEFLTSDAISKFNIKIVPQNTILLSFKLTIGRVAISSCALTTNEAIARFILSDINYREYTYFALKLYDYFKLGSTSSIATAVNSKIIKQMKILLPDKYILEKFHGLVCPLFVQI